MAKGVHASGEMQVFAVCSPKPRLVHRPERTLYLMSCRLCLARWYACSGGPSQVKDFNPSVVQVARAISAVFSWLLVDERLNCRGQGCEDLVESSHKRSPAPDEMRLGPL